eukprot:scaffold584_cov338-Pavlova_lutheri.AAC.32
MSTTPPPPTVASQANGALLKTCSVLCVLHRPDSPRCCASNGNGFVFSFPKHMQRTCIQAREGMAEECIALMRVAIGSKPCTTRFLRKRTRALRVRPARTCPRRFPFVRFAARHARRVLPSSAREFATCTDRNDTSPLPVPGGDGRGGRLPFFSREARPLVRPSVRGWGETDVGGSKSHWELAREATPCRNTTCVACA